MSRFKAFTMVSGKSFVTVSKNGISFSQAAIVELGKPEYVIILFDYEDKRMAIQTTDKDNPNATAFFKPNKKQLNVRWNNYLLKDKISSMMDWDLLHYSYKVEGSYDKEANALIFDMASAKKS